MRVNPLSMALLQLSDRDKWSAIDAFEGTIVFGGNGAGKTTGTGKHLAKAFLENEFGGLVLTVKVDEARRWQSYLHEAGRSEDLILVEPGRANFLNFLNYEARRSGAGAGLTYEIVRLLQTAMEGGRERSKAQDPFWDDAVSQLLTNSIDLVLLGTGQVNLPDVIEVIRTAPRSEQEAATFGASREQLDEMHSRKEVIWSEMSKCAQLLSSAMQRMEDTPDSARKEDLKETAKYFLCELANLDTRTRSNILATLMSRLTALLRSPFRQLFCGDTTVRPEDSFDGKVIVLNLPVKEYGEVGRFAQILFKTIWQRAVERRGSAGKPVFLWADEAQFFVTRYDMLFQQTARSSRAAAVYLTQSVVNFRAALDSSDDASSISDSLLGNLQTKIFHANACPNTNEYAERLFGSELQWTANASAGAAGSQAGAQRVMLPILPAIRFSTLKKGGLANDKLVQAYVFQAGRVWLGDDARHNKNWLLAEFRQDIEKQ
jgi:hypothetical protein